VASKSLAEWLKMLWENWGVCAWLFASIRVSMSPAAGGVHLSFIGQGEGELQVCRTIQLHGEVWPAPPQSWRPP
jgi:hypothetical protein